MARGRRGTVMARLAKIEQDEPQIEAAPRWEENDYESAVDLDELIAEARKDLAYAYVNVMEAMGLTPDPVEEARLRTAVKAMETALVSLGGDVETEQIIVDCGL